MKLVTLKGGGYSAVINLSRGANCVSLRKRGLDAPILREPDYEAGIDNPYLYGMPLLFPVNRIDGGEFSLGGRKYSFGINEEKTGCYLHGVIHEHEFTEVAKTESSITAELISAEGEIYEGFPHAFRIRLSYSLSEDGLTVICRVRNDSDTPMPSLIGYHTTFNARLDGNIRIRVPIKDGFERSRERYLPTGKMKKDSVWERLDEGSFSPLSEPISKHYLASEGNITITGDGGSVVYENCEALSYRLIYNGKADEYICLEPQNCLINGVNKSFSLYDKLCDMIPPHEHLEYTSKIYYTENKK